jgi:hypothetical protein
MVRGDRDMILAQEEQGAVGNKTMGILRDVCGAE